MAFVWRDFALTLFESNPFRTGTYSTEAFNKFPFNREAAAKVATISKLLIQSVACVCVFPGSQGSLAGQMGGVGRCHGSA